jgi:MurNAc alpha-1-phosphate uridylyltransferase
MKAMILAAGLGSRMRPLTDTLPKPLLEVHDKPLIVYHIEKLAKNGFKDIIINIAHLGYKISDALGDGSTWNVSITYSDEQEEGALESAGVIKKALSVLGNEVFLVVNADIWCEYEFNVKFNIGDNLAHIILVPNPDYNIAGDFGLDNKLVLNSHKDMFTFSGIGYYSPKLFKHLNYGKLKLAPLLREAIEKQKITGEIYSGIWKDIGTPTRLQEVNS